MLFNNFRIKNTQCTYTVFFAYHFLHRARGLLFRKKLAEKECLLISPCTSIHTIGMHYPLDIVFLDACGIVLEVHENISPFQFISCRHKAARTTVEFVGGSLKSIGLQQNDHLFEKINES
ncbi:DUF192 domain-containing protein [Acinetobacter sp. B5B]|uniref:DUF192 domain-containing protein n=1 Tax=Acinetobacter baretiae TaxID=2605383 RepID=UPI0018C2142F|nr:DUF192 domain-containing protein [Acinetobacter baretiae]MBF7683648.1 DUF192 domain-containing protein [Acinetobacter baretiae]